MPTAQDIINQYGTVYPDVEAKALNGTFKTVMDKIIAEYDACNLTGVEKAKLVSQAATAMGTTVIGSSQQAVVSLLSAAHNIPVDVEYKQEQTKTLRDSMVQNTLIKTFSELNAMIGSLGSGGLVAPAQMVYASCVASYAALASLKDKNGQSVIPVDMLNKFKPSTTVAFNEVYDMREKKEDGTVEKKASNKL